MCLINDEIAPWLPLKKAFLSKGDLVRSDHHICTFFEDLDLIFSLGFRAVTFGSF